MRGNPGIRATRVDRRRRIAGALLAGLVAACSDAVAPPGESDPGRFLASVVVRATAPLPVAYVSLPPGGIPGGIQATLRTQGAGGAITIPMIDGGFDPVPVPAAEGDTITISVVMSAGTALAYTIVPRRSRPTIVRTSPPKGKRDVALNSRVAVVFSEPIDPATLTASSIQLRGGGTAVPGAIRIVDSIGTVVEFVPATLLGEFTEYELVLTDAIRDLEGIALVAAAVPFTTGTSPLSSVATVTVEPNVLQLEVGLTLGVIAILRDAAGDTLSGRTVTWSSSEPMVATVSAAPVNGSPLAFATITAVAAGGPVTITATSEGKSASAQVSVLPERPPDRSGTYERETPHTAPGRHSRYIIGDDGTFELHDLNGSQSTVYTGSWTFATGWGGWPLNGGEVIILNFDGFGPLGICGHGFGVFLADGQLGIAYCAPPIQAGLEEGIYTVTPGSYLDPPPQVGQIAFVRDGRIYLANTDGSVATPLSSGPQDSQPAWSPDGKRIAFTRTSGGVPSIYIMNADGSNVVRRTSPGSAATWSPDGEWIAFTCTDLASLDICTMKADDDGAAPVNISRHGARVSDPAWSPDGRRIAFISDWAMFDFWFDIWVVAPDGSQATALRKHTPLTPNPYEQHQPSWSPDGQRLAYIECPWAWYVCSSSVIAVMNADGSSPVRLLVTSGHVHPTWSPDGQVIAFGSPNGIEWVSADGSARGLIIRNGHSPAWRP